MATSRSRRRTRTSSTSAPAKAIPRNNASFGNGIYRSNDGGETWTHLGLDDTDRIARIRIDSRNPDIAYVCALGREWGPNEQRGVFKTTDGGKNWQKVLYKDTHARAVPTSTSIPTNSNEIYAGMYTFLRQAWHLRSGGGETALYKSMDGGATWKKLTNGIPANARSHRRLHRPQQPEHRLYGERDAGLRGRAVADR